MEPEILLGEFDTLLLDNSGGQAGKAILFLKPRVFKIFEILFLSLMNPGVLVLVFSSPLRLARCTSSTFFLFESVRYRYLIN
jgi:hypothetical protein